MTVKEGRESMLGLHPSRALEFYRELWILEKGCNFQHTGIKWPLPSSAEPDISRHNPVYKIGQRWAKYIAIFE